jgi:hypothetical protein
MHRHFVNDNKNFSPVDLTPVLKAKKIEIVIFGSHPINVTLSTVDCVSPDAVYLNRIGVYFCHHRRTQDLELGEGGGAMTEGPKAPKSNRESRREAPSYPARGSAGAL